jgi:hypothetical protein
MPGPIMPPPIMSGPIMQPPIMPPPIICCIIDGMPSCTNPVTSWDTVMLVSVGALEGSVG